MSTATHDLNPGKVVDAVQVSSRDSSQPEAWLFISAKKKTESGFFKKIEEGFTSFTSSFDPEIWLDSPGMKILRDEKLSPEMGGSGSGNTLSILKKYESRNWTYNQRH